MTHSALIISCREVVSRWSQSQCFTSWIILDRNPTLMPLQLCTSSVIPVYPTVGRTALADTARVKAVSFEYE